MNKKLLVALAVLLKIDEKALTEAVEKEDGSEEVITNFLKENNVYTLADIEKLKSNAIAKKVEELEDLDVSSSQIPKKLYDKISGAALESKEKKLAKEHGVEEYNGLTDLVNKIVESKASGKGEGDSELVKQITGLKETVTRLEQENKDTIEEADKKHTAQLIGIDSNSAFDTFSTKMDYDSDPVDGAESILAKQTKLLKSAWNNDFGIIRKNDKNIVVKNDVDKTPVIDNLGEPMPILTVIEDFAKGYGFKMKEVDPGGRGSGGSEPKGHIKGTTFAEYAQAQGIKPNTEESDAAHVVWKAANPETK